MRDEEPTVIEIEEEIEENDFDQKAQVPAMRLLTYVIIAALVAVIAVAALMLARNWRYKSYRVLRSEKQEDTISSSYADVNGNILQYGSDGGRLSGRQGEEIWNINYQLQNPALVTCGSTLALYDQNGTEIVVADRDGKLGSYTAGLPIVKACVSEQGNVATIQEDESNAWIQYYNTSGEEIASIRTSMDNPGYPLDLSISPDGELLAVSYLSFTDGVQKGIVHIYSFGSVGQNQMDNRIAEFEYAQKVVPEVVFLDNKTCVAFRDNGFTVYEGTKVPKAAREVQVDREICSVFHEEDHIGMLLVGEEEGSYTLQVYNRSGGELIHQEIDFPYQHVEIRGSEISLYHGAALCLYSLNGTEKFNGAYTEEPRQFFAIGKHRYVVVTDSGFELIQLR